MKRTRTHRRCRASLEALEPRLLLTCDLRVENDNTLLIHCGDEDNIVQIVDRGGGEVDVRLKYRGGAVRQESFRSVKRVDAALEGGDDDISYRKIDALTTPPPIDGLRVDFGPGGDRGQFEIKQIHPGHEFVLDVLAAEGRNRIETHLIADTGNSTQINVWGGLDGWEHKLVQTLPGGELVMDVRAKAASGPSSDEIGHFHTLVGDEATTAILTPDGDDRVRIRSADSTGLARLETNIVTQGGQDEVDYDLVVDYRLHNANLYTDVGAGSDRVATRLDFSRLDAYQFKGQYHGETHYFADGRDTVSLHAEDVPGFGTVDSTSEAQDDCNLPPPYAVPSPCDPGPGPQVCQLWDLTGSTCCVGPTTSVSGLSAQSTGNAETTELTFAATNDVTGASIRIHQIRPAAFVHHASLQFTGPMSMELSQTARRGGWETNVDASTPAARTNSKFTRLRSEGATVHAQVDVSRLEIAAESEGYDQAEHQLRATAPVDVSYINLHGAASPTARLSAQRIQGDIDVYSSLSLNSRSGREVRLAIRDLEISGSVEVRGEGIGELERLLDNVSIAAGGSFSEVWNGTDSADRWQLITRDLRIAPAAEFVQDLRPLSGNDEVESRYHRVTNQGLFQTATEAGAGADRLSHVDAFFANYGSVTVQLSGGADNDELRFTSRQGTTAVGATTDVVLDFVAGTDQIDVRLLNLLVDGIYRFELRDSSDDDTRVKVHLRRHGSGVFELR